MYDLQKHLKNEPKQKVRASDGWGVVYGLGVTVIVAAVLMFLTQCYWWLRYGYWPDWTFLLFWAQLGFSGWPPTDWAGVNKLIFWIMQWPASLVIGGVGCLIAWVGISQQNAAKDREWLAKRHLDNPD